jgi:hypothetical protein
MFKNPYSAQPTELEEGDKLGFVVVAVVGAVGDWAAYALPVEGGEIPDPEYVATNGDKIDREAAERLFSACRNLRWRS